LDKTLATDIELIEGCRNRNSSMQRTLFERYAGKMMTVCRRYSRDKMEAEDMLQEGFIKVYQRISQHNGGSLEGWLKRVFINTCLDQWKKNKAGFFSSEWEAVDGASMEEDGLQKLQAQELLGLIDQLPSGAKLAFNLYALEGFPHSEIAEKLGISESASRAQVSRARKMLQDLLRYTN
jgi:RNA polymerase sigma-70 factor (ECF subfamily)